MFAECMKGHGMIIAP